MASNYTIGRLAKAARLPTTTLRYCERIGLLAACGRSESNYRLYDQAALERLLFIRAAQQSRFTLDDVSALIAVGDGIACRQVQGLIKHRLAELDARIRKLADVRRTLDRTLS
jgi:MerR family mercuric resistance operon transcriptional regulator